MRSRCRKVSTASFQVKLNTAPVSPTTVTVSRISGDTDITVQSGASLVFNSFQLEHGSNGHAVGGGRRGHAELLGSHPVQRDRVTSKNVTATEQDNTLALAIVTSMNAVTVPEGGTASFQVKLNTAPVDPTTVTVSRVSGDTNIYRPVGCIAGVQRFQLGYLSDRNTVGGGRRGHE